MCIRDRPGRSRTDWFRIIVIAFLGTALPGTLYFYAAIKVPAGILALTIATVPMLTYAAALCFRAESFSIVRLSGVACGFLGIVLLSQPEALPDPGLLPWVALALLCAFCYTAENIFVDLCVPRQTLLEPVLFGALLIASASLIPLMAATDSFVPLHFPFGSTEWALIAISSINCASYLTFLYLIQHYGAVFASLMGYVVTLSLIHI